MFKRFIFLITVLFLLAGCGPKAKIEFEPPKTGPDPEHFEPAYGPNDPAPVTDPRF